AHSSLRSDVRPELLRLPSLQQLRGKAKRPGVRGRHPNHDQTDPFGQPPVQHGDGTQTRDFIYVRDTVDAVVRLTEAGYRKGILNVCRGREIAIHDLLQLIATVMGWKGEIQVSPNPRGTDVKRHVADNSKLW